MKDSKQSLAHGRHCVGRDAYSVPSSYNRDRETFSECRSTMHGLCWIRNVAMFPKQAQSFSISPNTSSAKKLTRLTHGQWLGSRGDNGVPPAGAEDPFRGWFSLTVTLSDRLGVERRGNAGLGYHSHGKLGTLLNKPWSFWNPLEHENCSWIKKN